MDIILAFCHALHVMHFFVDPFPKSDTIFVEKMEYAKSIKVYFLLFASNYSLLLDVRCLCRSCRFQKCLDVGMDPNGSFRLIYYL